jgi:malate dehydrogenase
LFQSSILVIGAGDVGSFAAAVMARKQLGTIYLYDVMEDLAIGKAMDINHASPYLHTDTKVIGCNSLDGLNDIDIVVVTAGFARKAGMSRLDLLQGNIGIIESVGNWISTLSTPPKVLVVTNPVDVLTWYMKNRWPTMNVFGLGCSLDTMRFRYFLAEAVGGSIDCSQGMVIGTHNDNMIPLINHATIGGIPAKNLLTNDQIQSIIRNTRLAGTVITQKKRNHSGFYAAGHVVTQIVESMVFNRLGTFPCSVYCNNTYGYSGIYLALPVVIGKDGIGNILQIELDAAEQQALEVCAEEMRKTVMEIGG